MLNYHVEPKRDYLIDYLRFLAIVLMVFAHANMILNTSGWQINELGKNLGNFICFALFLFCSGAANFIQTKAKGASLKRSLKRIGWIYFAYLIVSIIGVLDSGSFDVFKFLSFAVFYNMPAYSEFLIAFMFFEFLYFILYKPLNKLGTNIIFLLLTTSITFFIANFLKDFDYGALNPITSLIWGRENYESFPFMQYLLFFLLGIFYAETFALQDEKIKKIELIISLTISGTLFLLANTFIQEAFRWPPNLAFRFGNISLLLFFILIFLIFEKFFIKLSFIKNMIHSVNRYTLHIFYFHIVVLFGLRWLNLAYSPIWAIVVTLGILSFFVVFDKIKRLNEDSKPQVQKI